MKPSYAPPEVTAKGRGGDAAPLRGRWLLIACVVWLIAAAALLALFVACIPIYFERLHTVCVDVACNAAPTPPGAEALRHLGLSATAYAAFYTLADVAIALVYLAIAVVVIWRQPAEPMALFGAFTLLLWGLATIPRIMGVLGDVSPWMGSVMVVQIYRFRRVAGPIQRQQTKWVVFGVTGSVLAFLGLALGRLLVSPAFPREEGVLQHLVVNLGVRGSSVLIPLAIGIAILRYRLWDIDPIINRALVYGTLTLALGLVYFGSVVVLQTLVRFFAGQGQASPLVVVSSTLTIAGLFQPLRRRIQATIDRCFYRRNYDAAQTLQAFSVTLRDEVDLNRLTANLLDVVEETMQPAHVSLWLRDVPSTARGRSTHDSPNLM